jgi:N-acetylneuraminic acid mutarotase
MGALTLMSGSLLAIAPVPVEAGCFFEPQCPAGFFTSTASLTTGRSGHTATLLADGRVLVVGGDASGGPPNSLASAELYDPSAATWTAAASLHVARSNQTATPIGGFRVLVVGGIDANYRSTPSAELYDVHANSWSPAASLTTRRYDQTATLLSNGNVLIAGGTQINTRLSSVEIYNPGIDSWQSGPNLQTGRSNATATLMSNGKVLMVGGIGQNGVLASAELYDADQHTWTPAASLSTARANHTAILLTTGQVLVAGGTGAAHQLLASAELYDPKLNRWSAAGPMGGARAGATGTLLDSGFVLEVGGNTGGGPRVEAYVPASDSWISTPELSPFNGPALLIGHTATALADGTVLVAGGVDPSTHAVRRDTERYLPQGINFQQPQPATLSASPTVVVTPAPSASGAWTGSSHMSTTRYGHTATLLKDGRVLVAGGASTPVGALSDAPGGSILSSAEGYDSSSNTWSSVGAMAASRFHHTATLLKDGRVLVAGGMGGSGALNSSELFDPTTNAWQAGPAMNAARARHTATLLADGRVLVVGGEGGNPLSSAEIYDPAANAWTVVAPMLAPRTNHTTSLLNNGHVLVVGGGNALTSAETFDPQANAWTLAASLSIGRTLHTATVLQGGKVLVAGGLGGGTWSGALIVAPLASTELYDPTANSWSTAGSMSAARYGQTATLLPNGELVGMCGGGPSGEAPSVEIFDPVSGTWTAAAPGMNLSPDAHTATLLPNGRLLVTGGENQTAALSGSEIFVPPATIHPPARGTTFIPAGARLPIAIGLILLVIAAATAMVVIRRRRHSI